MTRRDFILLTDALARAHADAKSRGSALAEAGVLLATEQIADALARVSPGFDRARFIADSIHNPKR